MESELKYKHQIRFNTCRVKLCEIVKIVGYVCHMFKILHEHLHTDCLQDVCLLLTQEGLPFKEVQR